MTHHHSWKTCNNTALKGGVIKSGGQRVVRQMLNFVLIVAMIYAKIFHTLGIIKIFFAERFLI